MIPFLLNVAQTFYKVYGQKISRFTFVFPNRRAGLFFQQYLSQVAGQPIFSPEILTISDLFLRLGKYKKADNIELLFHLYDIYRKISSSEESFDEFYFWGDMLLNDFDDVDKYMADASQLFRNIFDLRELEGEYNYLSPEQVAAIQRFWSSFLPVGSNEKKVNFLRMWEVLFQLYSGLRSRLAAKGLGYEGMIFRNVAEMVARNEDIAVGFEKIVFVGLNGHSKSEEVLLRYLQKRGIADFYFDYSSPLVQDNNNRASFFISKNRSLFPSQLSLLPENQFLEKPSIEIIGIPSLVGQGKFVCNILKFLLSENCLTPDKAINTAIVLPDENALLPILYSIPPDIDKINVTMGYSLSNAPVSGFIDMVSELHRNAFRNQYKDSFYHKNVLPILNHRYVQSFVGSAGDVLKQNIIRYNKIIIHSDELKVHPLLDLIFTPVRDFRELGTLLKAILSKLNMSLADKNTQDNGSSLPFEMESEFIIEYYKTVNKLEGALTDISTDMSIDTYLKLLKKHVQATSVSFSGEPLAGLQIMGVLETRSLDFENLVILSMNEGIFPTKKSSNSFIPYNLRKGFDLPTYEHQDSIFAYHFYRLINRARRVYLLYDTRAEGLLTGEVSRYFNQIKYLYPDSFDINEKLAVYKVSTSDSTRIVVEKTPEIMAKMDRFTSGGDKSLSASAINTYLNCPLQFYFSVVEGMDESDEVSESIEASTFGTIFHSVMEAIYNPLEEKMVTADLLKAIMKDDNLLTGIIEKSFTDNFFNTEKVRKLTGRNFLAGEVIRKYVKQVLAVDVKLTPFIYVKSEKKIVVDYTLPSGRIVSLKGFIDRIDNTKGKIRIIDYKTGRGDLNFRTMEDLFDKQMKNRPKAVMQVFMYAHLFLDECPDNVVVPGIYYLRDLFSGYFDPIIKNKGLKNALAVSDFALVRTDFKVLFDACIDEIFDSLIPFNQSQTGEPCKWCQFATICKK